MGEQAPPEASTRRSAWGLAWRNLFFPQFCRVCGDTLHTEENGYFCPRCWSDSPRVVRPFCTSCGRPHPGAVGLGARSNFPCAACREAALPGVDRIWGAALYEDAIAEAVKIFKFNKKHRLLEPFRQLLEEFIQAEMSPEQYHVLTPVPLHPVRQRHRGFNQSALLAQAVLPCFPAARLDLSLARIRPTRVQSQLGSEARRTSMRGAFAVMAADFEPGTRVLLMDDVVTTGSTVGECARALRRAGAASVEVLAVALSVSPKHPNM